MTTITLTLTERHRKGIVLQFCCRGETSPRQDLLNYEILSTQFYWREPSYRETKMTGFGLTVELKFKCRNIQLSRNLSILWLSEFHNLRISQIADFKSLLEVLRVLIRHIKGQKKSFKIETAQRVQYFKTWYGNFHLKMAWIKRAYWQDK